MQSSVPFHVGREGQYLAVGEEWQNDDGDRLISLVISDVPSAFVIENGNFKDLEHGLCIDPTMAATTLSDAWCTEGAYAFSFGPEGDALMFEHVAVEGQSELPHYVQLSPGTLFPVSFTQTPPESLGIEFLDDAGDGGGEDSGGDDGGGDGGDDGADGGDGGGGDDGQDSEDNGDDGGDDGNNNGDDGEGEDKERLSPGVIVGIVFGSLALLFLIAIPVGVVARRKRQTKSVS